MVSIRHSFITIFVLTFMQVEVFTFSTTEDCIQNIADRVKNERPEISTDFFLSNKQSNESLLRMCEYYVPHKIHKILQLVDGKSCNMEIITTGQLESTIYDSYVRILDQLGIYKGREIPNSFGQLNDYVVGMTKATFDRTVDQLAGICLHKSAEAVQ